MRRLIDRALNPSFEQCLVYFVLLLCALALCMGGCGASSQVKLDKQSVTSDGNPGSALRANGESAVFQGAAPTRIGLGGKASLVTPGPGLVMHADPESGELYLWSPKDTAAESVEITPEPNPGEPKVKMTGLEANMSDVAAVYADQFADAMEAIEGMTESEARRRIEEMRAAGKISSDVADAVTSVLPKLVSP